VGLEELTRLHDNTLGAAASALARLAHVHLVVGGAGAKGSGAGGIGGHFLVVAADLTDKVVESVFDVRAGLGGGLDELAAELSGQGFTLCMERKGDSVSFEAMRGRYPVVLTGYWDGMIKLCTLLGDDTLLLQITLVSDNNDGEVVLVLDAQNLLLEGHDFFKGLTRCDGVDEQEALAGAHVLFPHCRILLLACRVENIQESDLIVDNTLLAVGVWRERRLVSDLIRLLETSSGWDGRNPQLTFNCRVVLIHEVALDQLDRQARFSDTTTTDNHQLILSQELGRRTGVSH
jgi:hypothetical protein